MFYLQNVENLSKIKLVKIIVIMRSKSVTGSFCEIFNAKNIYFSKPAVDLISEKKKLTYLNDILSMTNNVSAYFDL